MEGVGNLTPAQLVDFLMSSCSDVEQETLDMIIRNKVSGKRATKYVIEDWQRIGLPYGDIKDIMDAIVSVKENIPPCHPPSKTITSSIASHSTSAYDSSRSLDREAQGKYDCLAPFFDAEDFLEMPDYEKDSYLNFKENYEFGISLGLHMEKPAFMKPKRQPETPPAMEKHLFVQPEICRDLDIDHSSYSRMRKLIASPSTSAVDTSRFPDREAPPQGKYDCLAPFFDAEDFLEMSDYEKDSYLN